MNDDLRATILSLGANLVGFADLSPVPGRYRSSLPFGVAIGIALDPAIVSLVPSGPTTAYLGEYEAVNAKLDDICLRASAYITGKGFSAVAQTVAYVRAQRVQDETERSPGRAAVPHKTVAALAGLGWIAKSSLLITPQYGSALRISSVLTDAPLEAAAVSYRCLCGTCSLCADACPGSAILGRAWQPGVDRDELIDFSACRRTVVERGRQIGTEHGACGVCMAVCPYTKRYIDGA